MKHQRCIAFVCCCAFTLLITGGDAGAARSSRTLTLALFVSGMGLQFSGSVLKASAQSRYDDYLNAAIQADIQARKRAYLSRQNTSVIMSRVGYGCIGLAVLFSIYNQLNTPKAPSPPDEALQNRVQGLHQGFQTHGGRYNGLGANRLYGNTSGLLQFFNRISPYYDWQTRGASLRFLHRF